MANLDSHKEKIAIGVGYAPPEKWNFNWEGDDFKMVEINKMIIYQIYMSTFFGEMSRDGESFIDVDKKLAYLKILGINAMELIMEPPGTVMDLVSDASEGHLTPDQAKYSPMAFANLVKTAHIHGIGVIMAVDYLHFGSRDRDLGKSFDRPENEKEDFLSGDGPWTPREIPDFERSAIRKSIRDHVFMWLEAYHCDGIRVKDTDFIRNAAGEDAHSENGHLLLKEINGEIRTKYPNKLLIAEDTGKKGFVIEPLVKGGLGFDIQWDPLFFHNIRFVLAQARDEDRTIQFIVDALAHTYGKNPFSRVVYSESASEMAKGMPRLPEEIHPGCADSPYAIKRSIIGAVITLTAPGIPLLFQGQEFITPGFFVGDERPDWDKMSHLQGIPQLFGDLIKLRKSDYNDYAGLQGGQLDFFHFNRECNILAYRRSHTDHSDHRVMVVINLSNVDFKKYVIGLPENGKWKLVFNSSSKVYDNSGTLLDTNDFMTQEKPYDGLPYQGSFALPKYSALLFIHYAMGSGGE
ncbi:MAG TPA: alpha amylase C-terminal domain-containing protein [Arenibacter sp.]|nr:alpha amylase C-terminal domain-containing protein [Arenibacter sp.]